MSGAVVGTEPQDIVINKKETSKNKKEPTVIQYSGRETLQLTLRLKFNTDNKNVLYLMAVRCLWRAPC